MSRLRTVVLGALAVGCLLGTLSRAAMVTEVRTSSGAVTVPVFDPSLGTLTHVDLVVSLVSVALTPSGGHAHSANPAPFSVTFPASAGGAVTIDVPPFSTTFGGEHDHAATAAAITIGATTLPSLSLTVTPDGGHAHSANPAPFSVTAPAAGGAVTIDVPPFSTTFGGEHDHTLAGSPQLLTFDPGELAVFLGLSDLSLTRSVSVAPTGGHAHSANPSPFSVTLPGGGAVLIDVPPFSTTLGGAHDHSATVWETQATFTFTPFAVPEPSTVLLFGVGGLTAWSAYRRRRVRNKADRRS